MIKSVSYLAVPGIPQIEPGDDLAGVIVDAVKAVGLTLEDGDILVLAQKIVSKAEGRYVALKDVVPSGKALEIGAQIEKDPRYVEVVLSESVDVVRSWTNVLIVTHRLGYVMANAGVDHSNISQSGDGERVLLLPKDPDGSAAALRERLGKAFGARVGVIINDSFGRPWRNGVVGVALGAAGVPALIDMIGAPDMFGRPMQVTEIAAADEIAAGASLVMGQAAEGLPVVIVRGLRFDAPERPASALVRPRDKDKFR
ncbi:MAG: coenzyme F420-0:L-glutamate ligase [Afipia sp.]|nr:coenzyme F420-0:L-glutamate ligase [Afipia sp.]OJW64462.1 MAG: coenzyme F420-0:L-glutamate ligase [Afipia sp. 64-13]